MPLHVGDIEIMHVFLQYGYWNPEELCSLNCCCTFLHAFWLLDICTGTGDSIDDHQIWLSHSPCLSNWNWPWQLTLSTADWQLWHLALSSALHLSCNQSLATPLGPWFPLPTPIGWYFETLTAQPWQVKSSQWEFFIWFPNAPRSGSNILLVLNPKLHPWMAYIKPWFLMLATAGNCQDMAQFSLTHLKPQV